MSVTLLCLVLLGQLEGAPQERAFVPRAVGTISFNAGAAYGASLGVPGLGIDGELGAQLTPRWLFTASAKLFGIIIIMNGQVGVLATYLLGERIGLGLGARVSQIQPLASHVGSPSTSLLVPVRLLIALSPSREARRQGLVLSFDVAPGVQFGGTIYSGALFAGSATLGIGYGSW